MALSLQASFERSCRFCAEEHDVTIMLFSEQAEAMLLQNKLNKYLSIQVNKDDKLPKNICINCCSKLQTICEFIDKAHKAQEELLKRRLTLDENQTNCSASHESNNKLNLNSNDTPKITEMEVSVDPMMVLQNSEELLSPNTETDFKPFDLKPFDDVTYLHGLDSENVTIKLIKKAGIDSTDGEKREHSKPFPCITCNRSFYTELALKNHSWTHINEEKPPTKYSCSQCDESFNYKCELTAHNKVHRKNGMCHFCSRVFRTERNLAAHMAVHLTEGKSYICKVCGRSYDTRSNLKTHSITHSNERPYPCHICKKSFKRNQDLKFHLNQHTGAKPYKCPFCEKSFASSGNCYSHRNRMHPGRRVESKLRRRPVREHPIMPQRIAVAKSPMTAVKGIYKYQCQLCNHSFLKRDNYTYHMYQHTGEKPFKCTLCAENFVTRRGLLLHHNKKHPSKDRPLALLSKNVLLQ